MDFLAKGARISFSRFYYNRNGQPQGSPRSQTLSPNTLWRFDVQNHTASGFVGSAIVDGAEDASVSVMNIHQSDPYASGSFVGLVQPAATLYLPLLQRANANGTMYSDLTVFNVGTASTLVQVLYLAENAGYDGCTTNWIEVPAHGSHNFDLRLNPECAGGPMSSPFVGGARVSSSNGQPLVAVANQWRYVDNVIRGLMSYEAFPAGSAASYMPLLQNNNNGWYTSSTLQDTSGLGAEYTISYIPESGSTPCLTTTPAPLSGSGIAIVFPSPPSGGCTPPPTYKFVGTGYATRSRNFAVVVNQEEFVTGNKKMSYSAVGGGTSMAIVPWVMKNKDGWQGRNDWYTGLNVQNLSTGNATVTVIYYDKSGVRVHDAEAGPVSPRANVVFFPAPVGDAFVGSAVITANQPIAVVVNHFSADPEHATDDTYMSHTGLNR